METNSWYTLDNIKRFKALWNMIIGERSNGKTFSVLEEILNKKLQRGEEGAVIRRWDTDLKGRRKNQVWAGIVEAGKLNNTEWDGIDYRNGAWYLYRWLDDEKTDKEFDFAPLAYPFSLTNMEHDKSTSYPKVTTILFDEFTSRKGYLPDEFALLCNVISTIVRQRDNVTIYMCGNTVSKMCPYFREMGLNHVDTMQQGEIQFYEYGEKKECTLAVEYCSPLTKKIKKSDRYFAFDNPKLEMIKNGLWETAVYPRLPVKYQPSDVVMPIYIVIDDVETFTIKGDVVCKDGNYFMFMYRKDYGRMNEDEDIVFSARCDYRHNWRRNMMKPFDNVGKNIAKLFTLDKVYYANNDVGELVRSYLQFCTSSSIIKL